ncbi:MAG: aspartate-semialdehyde dehydrogenase [Clostridia bacterium]|nr:aspartate-semialdehyde dehydrogenase [Deltaproteobacteria bacterium]
MSKNVRVAVVGATGLVGRQMINILEERGFPLAELVPMASARSLGEAVEYQGREVPVRVAAPDAFKGIDIVLMSAGGTPAKILAPAAAEAGAIVIDNSSAWRMDPDVPLVVPEVNPEDIALFKKKRIIANPNCSTIQMVVALAPLHRENAIKRIVVSTYQAVSGKGKNAMEELSTQVTQLFSSQDAEVKVFPKQIAFNCLPQIDDFTEDGFTKEEHKMVNETRKIMHAPGVGVVATCVRVPVFNGHAVSAVAEFTSEMSVENARSILREAKGVMLMDDPSALVYPTQLEADGTDATLVGRIRKDPSAPNSLALWIVADNLRKGAATNAVQIAEILVRDHLAARAVN